FDQRPDRRQPRRDQRVQRPGIAPARPDHRRTARNPALAASAQRSPRHVEQCAARPRPTQGVRAEMIRMSRCLMPLLLLLLAACAALGGKKEPFTVYAPRYTPPASAANAPRIEWQLAIDTPLAS